MALSARVTRFILITAVAGIVALTLAGACLMRQGVNRITAPKTPAYCRINISQGSAVYLEFKGRELRAAMSVEGFKTAVPVTGMAVVTGHNENNMVGFQEVSLPITAKQLPAGVTAIKAANISLYGLEGPAHETPATILSGEIVICRTDDQKAEWQYVTRFGSRAGESPDKPAAIALPNLEKLALTVTAKPASGVLGVGVGLAADGRGFSDIRKDGSPVAATVRVLDASGKEVASKKGPLSAFGFS